MKLWEILLLIAAITVALIVIVLVVTACVIAGRESRKEEDKDDARYIDADKLKERLMVGSELDPEPCKGFRSALLAMVDTQEDADVRENVHAHWEGDGQCSNCKDYPLARYMRNPNFCPNCGAEMEE